MNRREMEELMCNRVDGIDNVNEANDAAQEALKEIIDYFESVTKEIYYKLEISDINDIGNILDACEIAKSITEDLY